MQRIFPCYRIITFFPSSRLCIPLSCSAFSMVDRFTFLLIEPPNFLSGIFPSNTTSISYQRAICLVSAPISMPFIMKYSFFMMKGMDIGALTRQMARWYDIEVVFEGKIPDKKFGGSISRNVNLSTILKALQESGIQSRLEGKKVIIL